MRAVPVQKAPAAQEAPAADAETVQQRSAALAALAASGGACLTGLRALHAAQQAGVAWACRQPAWALAAWVRAGEAPAVPEGAVRRATGLAAPGAWVRLVLLSLIHISEPTRRS